MHGSTLYKVSEKEIFMAIDLINNRHRECLGFKTPFEVFAELNYFLKWKCCTYGVNLRFYNLFV